MSSRTRARRHKNRKKPHRPAISAGRWDFRAVASGSRRVIAFVRTQIGRNVHNQFPPHVCTAPCHRLCCGQHAFFFIFPHALPSAPKAKFDFPLMFLSYYDCPRPERPQTQKPPRRWRGGFLSDNQIFVTILMPGPMVDAVTQDLMYWPFAAAGLALMIAPMSAL